MNMKPILIIITLLTFFSCQEKKATINIDIFGDRNSEMRLPFSNIRMFKNGILVRTIDSHGDSTIILNVQEYGTYELVYLNVLEIDDTIKVDIQGNKSYPVIIYYNEISDKYLSAKSVVNQLEKSDTLKIFFFSKGCAHELEDSIFIWKKENNYTLQYANKIKKLKMEQLRLIDRFYQELILINEKGGCTTEDRYTIQLNSAKTDFFDRTCDWNGFQRLKEML